MPYVDKFFDQFAIVVSLVELAMIIGWVAVMKVMDRLSDRKRNAS